MSRRVVIKWALGALLILAWALATLILGALALARFGYWGNR